MTDPTMGFRAAIKVVRLQLSQMSGAITAREQVLQTDAALADVHEDDVVGALSGVAAMAVQVAATATGRTAEELLDHFERGISTNTGTGSQPPGPGDPERVALILQVAYTNLLDPDTWTIDGKPLTCEQRAVAEGVTADDLAAVHSLSLSSAEQWDAAQQRARELIELMRKYGADDLGDSSYEEGMQTLLDRMSPADRARAEELMQQAKADAQVLHRDDAD